MINLREVNTLSIILRILLSIAIGGVLGIERGRKNRPAGFRTYMLVCLGSAMVMMTNQYVFQTLSPSDPVRMGAQVVSGIGFLGAGTIILTGKNQVKGITTAAGLWTAACCGLAVGIGFYEGAVAGGIAVFLIMALLQRMDENIRRTSSSMEIYLEFDGKNLFSGFIENAREGQIEIYDIQMQKNKIDKEKITSIVLTAKGAKGMSRNDVLNILSDAPGVLYIEELG